MFKRLSRSPAIPFIGGTLIWAYMAIMARTLRWRIEGLEHIRPLWEGDTPFLLATWHSRILLMAILQTRLSRRWKKPPHPTALMVSNSRDGEFTRRSGIWLRLHIIRGSAANKSKTKDKRGMLGAREAMRVMSQGGGVCVTIDGPKGPPEVVGLGAVKLAQQMNAPIVLYGLSADARRLKTWDRLLFPLPFARAAVVFPKPVATSKSMDSESLRNEVERALKEATARANVLAGLKDAHHPSSSSALEQAPQVEAVAALERGGP
ncbi:MAG: DUF374 domain-containing protein [Alphaproteobacteria bacterium]|nr:DUF374 domain-containing protein [Alphaproteobacteria bacterium]